MELENIPEKPPQVWIPEGLTAAGCPAAHPCLPFQPVVKFAGVPRAFVWTGREVLGELFQGFGGDLCNPVPRELSGDAAGSGC